MPRHRKLIALDFDGVLHSYTTPWSDAATIADGPTPGAMQFLRDLIDDDRFDVVVVSSRCSSDVGKRAIDQWLQKHLEEAFGNDFFRHAYTRFDIVSNRSPAFLTIDDRAHQFTGTWPDLDNLAAFKPWNKRPPADPGAHDRRVEDAVRYAVQGGAGFDTGAERVAAELGARRAISMMTGEVGMFDPSFVSDRSAA